MSRPQAAEFHALSEKMGHPLTPAALQRIFRKNWNLRLEDWTELNDDTINKVETELRKRVCRTWFPGTGRGRFYEDLTRLVNAAWGRSWNNMKHERTRKAKRGGKGKTPKESDEMAVNGASSRSAQSDAIVGKIGSNETTPSETTQDKQSTKMSSFRPW